MIAIGARRRIFTSTWAKAIAVVVLVAFAVFVPLRGSPTVINLALNILIFGLLAMSLDLMAGYAGLVSLGHAAFLGAGAYGVAMAEVRGRSPGVAIVIALVAVLLLAMAFGILAIRVRELTFVILTLSLSQVVWGMALLWVNVSGGDNGLAVRKRPVFGPFDLAHGDTLYFAILAVFLLCAVALWTIVRSPFGLTLRGIRDNEPRMRTLGFNVTLHKYVAYIISGFVGGIAGIMYAFYNLYVTPVMIDFPHNGNVVLMAIMGGMGSLWGPLLGAAIVVLVQLWVSIHVTRWLTLLGLVFVLTVLFTEKGLWGALRRFPVFLDRMLSRTARRPATAGASDSGGGPPPDD